MKSFFQKVLHKLLPYQCLLCGLPSDQRQDLCIACSNDLPLNLTACLSCARPWLELKNPCDYCYNDPPAFDKAYALYLYQTPITKLIMDLKFGAALMNAAIMGQLLAKQLKDQWYKNKELPEVIIPIPLHKLRLRERGFNQALEIARPIARSLKIPLNYLDCKRVKNTAPQATLTASERENNVKSAFQVKPLSYQYVAVVDDVITTGHTVNALCEVLKTAGVKTIDVWCCARPLMRPRV